MRRIPVALSIAGSDPSGGAGIQADIKTFTALGVYGMAVITSVTVQDTTGVRERFDLPPELVYRQIEIVVEDIGADAVKTGMLGKGGIILSVAKAVKDLKISRLVVDPVLRSKNEAELTEDLEVLTEELLPLSTLVTPNIPEAERICDERIKDLKDAERCAKRMLELGPEAVLIKGGHLEGDKVTDLLCLKGGKVIPFSKERVSTENTHGTGCTLSAAITSFLARGFSLIKAVERAESYVHRAIENSLSLGRGRGPLNHIWNLRECTERF